MRLQDEISKTELKNSHQKAFQNLIFTTNWLNGMLSTDLKQFGLTNQQYNILRILRGQYPQPSTIKLIRSRMLDRMSDTSRIVKNLWSKELIDRKVDAADRRNVHIFINEKGLDLLQQLDHIDDLIAGRMCNLNDDEILILNQLLDKLRG